MNGCIISGNSNTIGDTLKSLGAWRLSSQWILDMDEWKECFGGEQNRELALKYSRKHFKKMFPEYFKRARCGAISDKHKKEMFNIFYNENTLIEEVVART